MTSRIAALSSYGRPLICTEFMARGNGSTFEAILPILKQKNVGAYCWGLVDGKSQTKQPWSTWQQPILGEPEPWHHDIFRTDGTPYSEAELKLIRQIALPVAAPENTAPENQQRLTKTQPLFKILNGVIRFQGQPMTGPSPPLTIQTGNSDQAALELVAHRCSDRNHLED